jgi:hypothetical protein
MDITKTVRRELNHVIENGSNVNRLVVDVVTNNSASSTRKHGTFCWLGHITWPGSRNQSTERNHVGVQRLSNLDGIANLAADARSTWLFPRINHCRSHGRMGSALVLEMML